MKRRDDAAMIFNRGASLMRPAFFCLGCLMVFLGIVGAFVPLMPTTIFLILAAWCFGRSSRRLETWLLEHPRFGKTLRAWRTHGAIPRRAKLLACAGMALGFAIFWLGIHPSLLVTVGVATLFLGSAAYVVPRPSLVAVIVSKKKGRTMRVQMQLRSVPQSAKQWLFTRHLRAVLLMVALSSALGLAAAQIATAQESPAATTISPSGGSPGAARSSDVNPSQPGGGLSSEPLPASPVLPTPDAAPVAPAESPSAMPADTRRSVSAKNLPQDLSPWGMFLQADIVVKAVMIGLAFASLVTWTVWLAKAIELGRAKRRLRRGISQILSAVTLREAAASFEAVNDTSAVLVREALDELRVSARMLDHTSSTGVNERVTSRLSRVETEAGQRMTKGTGVLATIGATAPFVGLFGTVWGIMNAFIGISQSQTTNLAVVAPGIAEALLATALGLVAAIPAVIIYNVFARSITGYRRLLGDASAGIERLVSRELDFRRLPASLSHAAE